MPKPPDHQVFEATHTSDEAITALGIGIYMREPAGPVSYWIGEDGELWKRIGRVSVDDDGMIEIWPCADVSDDDIKALRGAGSEAWQRDPCEENSWSRHNGYWDCRLSVPVEMILDAEVSNHQQAPLVADLETAA
jgi:hypothetical protein